MIGKLQTNKVRDCLKYFDFIHSVDSKKLAKKIFDEQIKQKKKVSIFIQINVGDESQKAGVKISELGELLEYCNFLKLNIIGLMCIPPNSNNPNEYFIKMENFKKKYNQENLSMGMSADYIDAIKNSSNFVRIGTSIFGNRN